MSKVKENLISIRKNIKKKLLALKLHRDEQNKKFEETYKPILQPLNKIVADMDIPKQENNFNVKKAKEEFEEHKDIYSEDYSEYSTPEQNKKLIFSTPQRDSVNFNVDNLISEKDASIDNGDADQSEIIIKNNMPIYSTNTPFAEEFLQQYNQVQREYIAEYFDDLNKNPKFSKVFDRRLGLVYDSPSKKWKVGKDDVVILKENKLKIGDFEYDATPGLYELLFKKDPIGATGKDIDTYVDILKKSHALHRNYNSRKQRQGDSSRKYKKIIQPRLQSQHSSHTGSGVDNSLRVEDKPYRAIYWNDPNELVERLWLLHASKKAGNNAHDNEISALEEELREAEIIL